MWVFKQDPPITCVKTINTNRRRRGSDDSIIRKRPKTAGRCDGGTPAGAGIALALPADVKRQAQCELGGPPVDVAGDAKAHAVHVSVPPVGVNLTMIESAIIRFALARNGGNQTHTAQFLHVSRSALLYRMRKYGLAEAPRHDDAPPAQGTHR